MSIAKTQFIDVEKTSKLLGLLHCGNRELRNAVCGMRDFREEYGNIVCEECNFVGGNGINDAELCVAFENEHKIYGLGKKKATADLKKVPINGNAAGAELGNIREFIS